MRLAILLSGSGSTAEAVLQAHKDGAFQKITPVVVISSSPTAAGIAKAKKYGMPVEVVEKTAMLLPVLQKHNAELISQNGWLPFTPKAVTSQYHEKIINQHPGGLDPEHSLDFGGAGMYGRRVLAATALYYQRVNQQPATEITIHYVDDRFDHGGVILRERIELPPLAGEIQEYIARIHPSIKKAEHTVVIKALQQIESGKAVVQKRKTPLIPPEHAPILAEVKKVAISLYPEG